MSRSEPFPGGPSGPRDTGSLSNLRRDAAQLTTKTNATPARRSNSRAHHGPLAPGRGGAGALATTRWSVAASTTVRYGSSCGYLAEARSIFNQVGGEMYMKGALINLVALVLLSGGGWVAVEHDSTPVRVAGGTAVVVAFYLGIRHS